MSWQTNIIELSESNEGRMVCRFLAGMLWYDYEYTQDKNILEEAEKFTASLEFLSAFRLMIMIWAFWFFAATATDIA